MKVEFIDLKAQYASIKKEIDNAILDVLSNAAFSGGPFVKKFEDDFAGLHTSEYCAGVNNGTSALHAVLMALGIGPGDEVIVPANTFFATAEAVSLTGAVPVFADCEEKYFNINPDNIEKSITQKTRAVIAVHLYGQPARIDTISDIAGKNNLFLIEDCAQAVISKYNGKSVGTTGIAGCFSFYPSKNLGAYGEGGAVITGDKTLYEKILALRDHGSNKKYYHDFIGHNYRMSGFQGAILSVKSKYIDQWTEIRRRNAELYQKHLKEIKKIVLPEEMPGAKHVYHLYVILSEERDKLQKYLSENDIGTGIHYPIPCHIQKAYAFLNYREGSLPVCEKLSDRILSLPMSEQLTEDGIEYVCKKIKEFYS